MSEFEGQIIYTHGQQEEENVTAADYEKALANLDRYAAKDITGITTLDDLAFEMIFVGLGLRMIIVTNGELKEYQYIWKHPATGDALVVNRWHAIQEPVGENIIYTTTKNGYAQIQQVNKFAALDFDLTIPFDRKISMGNELERGWKRTFAVDYRESPYGTYYPTEQHDKMDALQGYARVVQEGVRAVLTVTPPPTQVPNFSV